MIVSTRALVIGLGAALLALCLQVNAADEAKDLSSLKQDIEALKAGQRQMAKDLAAIKRMIQSLKAPQKRRQPVQDVDLVMDLAQEPSKGDANAPLVMVEMTDFQCPFCGRHVRAVMPEIMTKYVSTGKLRYVVRDFPLPFHKQAEKAAEAAHCAESQGKYWEMHQLLFENQKALDAEHLTEYAAQLNLDPDAFKACLDGGEFAAKVQADHAEGSKAGVTGTPTMFLGRPQADGKVKLTKRITGAQPIAIFQQTIDTLLKEEKGDAPVEAAQPEEKEAGS